MNSELQITELNKVVYQPMISEVEIADVKIIEQENITFEKKNIVLSDNARFERFKRSLRKRSASIL